MVAVLPVVPTYVTTAHIPAASTAPPLPSQVSNRWFLGFRIKVQTEAICEPYLTVADFRGWHKAATLTLQHEHRDDCGCRPRERFNLNPIPRMRSRFREHLGQFRHKIPLVRDRLRRHGGPNG